MKNGSGDAAPERDCKQNRTHVLKSFRPPFSKGGTDQTPWGVCRPSQRAESLFGVFF
jgi:hypothetical protein